MMNLQKLPNQLTIMRIILIPVLVLVYYLPVHWHNEAAATLFVLAAITDWLDGYLARRWQAASRFGAFLDPVADKLIVAAALVMLVQSDPSLSTTLPVIIIISREIIISALREWMASIGENTTVAVAYVGKLKTAAQMIAITLLIYGQDIAGSPIYTIGLIALYAATLLTLWSMIQYLRAAWSALQ
jgi:CDP-diacylglycerol--glycerol-3-phosphate 3-phosphatidyltransferase